MSQSKQAPMDSKSNHSDYEVESILQRGHAEGQVYYLVKWKGFSDSESTWQPKSNLTNCKDAIRRFERIIEKIESEKIFSKKNKKQSKKQKVESDYHPSNLPISKNHSSKRSTKRLNQTKILKHNTVNISQVQRTDKQSREFLKTQQQNNEKEDKNQSEQSESEEENDFLVSQMTTAETIFPERKGNKDLFNNDIDGASLNPNGCNKEQTLIQSEDLLTQKLSKQIKLHISSSSENHQEKVVQHKQRPKNSQNSQQNRKRAMDFKKGNDLSESKDDPSLDKVHKKVKTSDSKEVEQLPSQQKRRKNSLKSQIFTFNINCRVASDKTKTLIRENEYKSQEKWTQAVIQQQSHRFRLCEQYFLDLRSDKFEAFEKNKIGSQITQKMQKSSDFAVNCLLNNFLDLSTPECVDINSQMMRSALPKEEVLKLDEEGEFLYSQIESLIKGIEIQQNQGKFCWVCVITSHHQNQSQPDAKQFWFVKVDDVRQDTWRRMFRKFTLKNSRANVCL